MSLHSGAARTLLLSLAVIALFAAGIARLRRVPRPTFVLIATMAEGRVRFGRVELVRRGAASGTVLGHAVVCGGRERVSVPGMTAPIVRENRGLVTIYVSPARIVSLDPSTCAVH